VEEEVMPIVPTQEQPENVLDAFRQKRQAIADTKDVLIALPGYDADPPRRLARYRLLNGHELTLIGDKVRREVKGRWDRQIIAAVDTFIASIEGFFVDLGDGSDPVDHPLTYNGEPVTRFDQTLAEALAFENDGTARGVVFGLFGGNEVMVSRHNFQLNRWMSDTSSKVDDELMGGNL
jgi:hypothetical protein